MATDVYERLAEINNGAWTPDGFEAAFIGMGFQFGSEPMAIYDWEKCIEILEDHGMTREEAVNFFQFNTLGCYPGDGALPIFVRLEDRENADEGPPTDPSPAGVPPNQHLGVPLERSILDRLGRSPLFTTTPAAAVTVKGPSHPAASVPC